MSHGRWDRDACGVGAIARFDGRKDPEILSLALEALIRFEHRGGVTDGTGDGAGLIIDIDKEFFRDQIPARKRPSDEAVIGVAVLFLPHGEHFNDLELLPEMRLVLRRQALELCAWRSVPVRPESLGTRGRETMPNIVQLIFAVEDAADLDARLLRARLDLQAAFQRAYVASMSTRTIVYKALATSRQLVDLYPDLTEAKMQTAFAIIHRRFSTNTISNWFLAQPFRFIAQNGEINTIKANRNAVRDLSRARGFPTILQHQGSDSADFDRALELLLVHDLPLGEALMRMMPPAHREITAPDPEFVRFLEASRRTMGSFGAFEGPAAILATDGKSIVAALDRMGLRPLRCQVTTDGLVFVGTEIGAAPFPLASVAQSAQLDPGEMIEIDLVDHVLRSTQDLRKRVVERSKLDRSIAGVHLTSPRGASPEVGSGPDRTETSKRRRLLAAFGWSDEERKMVRHLAKEGKEPITSMGWDRPLAILDPRPLPLYDHFHQTIAVVTNPPIDPIREGGVIELSVHLGPRPDLSARERAEVPSAFFLEHPVLSNRIAAEVRTGIPGELLVRVVPLLVPESHTPREMERALEQSIESCIHAIENRQANMVWLSDRGAFENGMIPLPMPLAVSGVHHGLVKLGLRRKASIIAEAGDVAEGHDLAVLLAHGADAVNPYLLFDEAEEHAASISDAVGAVERGIVSTLKRIMSKMGITSIEGYIGSQLFEAVGVSDELIDRFLPGTSSVIGGIGLQEIHRAAQERAERSVLGDKVDGEAIPVYRKAVTSALQEVARSDDPGAYQRYLELIRETPPTYLRDLLEFKLCTSTRTVEEVESAKEIVRRCFRGAAMSHGALNEEAHRAIALVFNRLGSSSNAGEGGEDERRNKGGPWDRERSRIRQVASARFGVDAEYLVNADELEIKIGQGAKPGEGGHLPGYKVTEDIARIRRTRPGITLISPPPHHDIYSIEDLAQLIDSLRQTHPGARIGVKTPATVELGTIVVGVAKAGADVITISGFEGGTGAASRSSIEHAGLPLERGLAESHRTLFVQGIRDRVSLRADGGIKTGLDVAKLLALGADEVAFGTALMVAEQCIMCRGCSFGKCPTGITTQDPHYKKRFLAKILSEDAEAEARMLQAADGIERVLLNIAGELREILAALGLRSTRDLIGRTDLLIQQRTKSRRHNTIDLSTFLDRGLKPAATGGSLPQPAAKPPLRAREVFSLNARLIDAAKAALDDPGRRIDASFAIENTDRSTGATLSGRLASIYQSERFELGRHRPRSITLRFTGYAGQGFGFALADGITLHLDGFANDTAGAGMSAGAAIIVRAPRSAGPQAHAVGNAACYGATGGVLFVGGWAGQRLGVRNSGSTIVAEGAGKYAFEYMTEGIGVLLSASGPVIGSGLTGGTLYLFDEHGDTRTRVHADTALMPLGADDRLILRTLLERFADATQSARARLFLETFDLTARRFLKGIARDLAARDVEPRALDVAQQP